MNDLKKCRKHEINLLGIRYVSDDREARELIDEILTTFIAKDRLLREAIGVINDLHGETKCVTKCKVHDLIERIRKELEDK